MLEIDINLFYHDKFCFQLSNILYICWLVKREEMKRVFQLRPRGFDYGLTRFYTYVEFIGLRMARVAEPLFEINNIVDSNNIYLLLAA